MSLDEQARYELQMQDSTVILLCFLWPVRCQSYVSFQELCTIWIVKTYFAAHSQLPLPSPVVQFSGFVKEPG